MYFKSNLQPGINRNSTKADTIGGYWDCNNVRFNNEDPVLCNQDAIDQKHALCDNYEISRDRCTSSAITDAEGLAGIEGIQTFVSLTVRWIWL